MWNDYRYGVRQQTIMQQSVEYEFLIFLKKTTAVNTDIYKKQQKPWKNEENVKFHLLHRGQIFCKINIFFSFHLVSQIIGKEEI